MENDRRIGDEFVGVLISKDRANHRVTTWAHVQIIGGQGERIIAHDVLCQGSASPQRVAIGYGHCGGVKAAGEIELNLAVGVRRGRGSGIAIEGAITTAADAEVQCCTTDCLAGSAVLQYGVDRRTIPLV